MSPLLEPDFEPADFPAEGITWLNSPALTLRALRGSVVLLDFWELAGINPLRALPYTKAWHERYADKGLVAIGVHTPEYHFSAEAQAVRRAVDRLGVRYPMIVDSDYAVWRLWANQCWPTRYLVGPAGRLRYYHAGEGQYLQSEIVIQALLTERDPAVALPALMEPLRPEDRPGARLAGMTDPVHMGYWSPACGNPQGLHTDQPADYALPGGAQDGQYYLSGRWLARQQYVTPAGEGLSELALPFRACTVNLVAGPAEPENAQTAPSAAVRIALDGQTPPRNCWGADLQMVAGDEAGLRCLEGQLYELLDFHGQSAKGMLRIQAAPGTALYAVTFSTCVEG